LILPLFPCCTFHLVRPNVAHKPRDFRFGLMGWLELGLYAAWGVTSFSSRLASSASAHKRS
jgi:hypothetical protein